MIAPAREELLELLYILCHDTGHRVGSVRGSDGRTSIWNAVPCIGAASTTSWGKTTAHRWLTTQWPH